MRLIAVAVLSILLTAGTGHAGDAKTFDVVIYGATPGGLAAAIAAARQGASVVVIEPTRHIGGMVTGGLSHTDIGREECIGGIAREFFTRADAHYKDAEKTKSKELFMSEPHVAERTFNDMVREAGVTVVLGQRLTGVTMNGKRIAAITTQSGDTYAGKVFIDAGYEGDVMAKAGVSYIVGRESRKQFDETLAGFYPDPLRPRTIEDMREDDKTVGGTSSLGYVHGTPIRIPARGADGKLLWGVFEVSAEPGDGDRKSQSYNFRIIMTRDPRNQTPFPKPASYDPRKYEILLRVIEAFPGVRFSKLVHFGPIPGAGGKFDVNASGMVMGTDHPGFNFDYPEGDAATRERIYQDHVDYVQGFLWFLGHDERVPRDLRDQVNQWGLAKDEFTDNGNWPYALYVREARRMVSDYVMRQQDCQAEVLKSDSVAMGSFILDSHCVQRIVSPDGYVMDEGNFDMPARPYQIPYRSIVPRTSECENLLVPVCLSATHVSYGSIRMEPVFMSLGHAAGLAAVMSVRSGAAVQAVDVAGLQKQLREQKQVLELQAGKGAAVITLTGIYMDDQQAKLVGAWKLSNSGAGVSGMYRHDADEGKGNKSATFELNVPKEARYDVRFTYAPFPNRAANVPVAIRHADGVAHVTVNEQKKPPIDGVMISLGTFRFVPAPAPAPGSSAVITVTTEGTKGYVAVDAVQLVPVE